ncbi:MAG: hypothetical protein ACKOQY_09060, partial [Bacteroidota bacterium]
MRNNWVYANLPSRTNQFNGIVFGEHILNTAQSVSAEVSNVTIEDNYIDLTSTSSNATPAATSITGARGIVFTNMFRNGGADHTGLQLSLDDGIVGCKNRIVINYQTRVGNGSATVAKHVGEN